MSRPRVLLFVMLIQILKFSAYALERHSISNSLRIHKQGYFNEEIPAKVGNKYTYINDSSLTTFV